MICMSGSVWDRQSPVTTPSGAGVCRGLRVRQPHTTEERSTMHGPMKALAPLLVWCCMPAFGAAAADADGPPAEPLPRIELGAPYQFPGLERLPDGRIQLSFHVEADSATAYGKPAARAVSADEGRSWKPLPREAAGDGTAASWQAPPLRLPNGDAIWVVQQRPLDAAGLKLPAQPVGRVFNYQDFAFYRVADLPAECADGWHLMRLPAGGTEPRKERAAVRLPGELRCVTEGVMPRPWLQTLFLAPDGSIWAVQYDTRLVDGGFKPHWWAMILRSTDGGRSFDLWSEIPYVPDAGADPQAAARGGFTEPTVCFMADGAAVCLLRTTDDKGPGPLYIARSTDHGKSWSRPAVFDDLGVWPQMLRLKNGVTLAAYGRPGLYVRGTADPAGLRWGPRVTVVPPGKISTDTCSYTAFLPLGDDRALLAYSEFNLPDAEGRPRKAMRVREVRATVGSPAGR
jgi:hypothetical protein